MRGAFKILTIRGISLLVHWTFLLLIGWVLLVNAQLGNNPEQLIWSLLFVVAVFACVTLHELGHALMAARFGIKAKNIILLPIGGIASIEKFPGNPRQEMAISLAGPLVSMALAGLCWLLLPAGITFGRAPADVSIVHGHDFIYNLFVVNVAIAVFNLIPAFPMDGGRILRALLALRLNYVRATAIAATVGKVFAVLFIVTGFFFFNIILAFIGIFILFSASSEEYYLRLKDLVKGIKIKEVLMYDYDSLQANATVKEVAGQLMNNHSRYFMVMEGAEPVGTVNRMDIITAIADRKYDCRVRDLMTAQVNYLEADKEVETVLEKLAGHEGTIYPVKENNHFTGVINFSHLIEYLLINKADSREYNRIKSLAGLI